ncbi:hypothetical protein BDZ89DRAFT_142010 [Hymenopellis radicata]|nr:hypothetical protein BDZ89DRAFT_142010 [Hymenopellis radicata]
MRPPHHRAPTVVSSHTSSRGAETETPSPQLMSRPTNPSLATDRPRKSLSGVSRSCDRLSTTPSPSNRTELVTSCHSSIPVRGTALPPTARTLVVLCALYHVEKIKIHLNHFYCEG